MDSLNTQSRHFFLVDMSELNVTILVVLMLSILLMLASYWSKLVRAIGVAKEGWWRRGRVEGAATTCEMIVN